MLPWERMDDFLLHCGKKRVPSEFSKAVLYDIRKLIPYDQARLYFLSGTGEIEDALLVGVDQWAAREYFDYYSREGAFSMRNVAFQFSMHAATMMKTENCLFDTEDSYSYDPEFYRQYVRPHHIHYSFGLALRDPQNTLKVIISLDRTGKSRYSQEEIEIMRRVKPHLDNLYQNFYVAPTENLQKTCGCLPPDLPLTKRETEIAALLAGGESPASISHKLCISVTTVHKHIAHIHAKLKVSSRQELMVKLLTK